MKPPKTAAEYAASIKEYAQDHYEDGGWDTFVECYTDAELLAFCQAQLNAQCCPMRIAKSMAELWAEREQEIRSTVW